MPKQRDEQGTKNLYTTSSMTGAGKHPGRGG